MSGRGITVQDEENGENGENGDGLSTWVMCDTCGKWRRLQVSTVEGLPEQWRCEMNSDVRAWSLNRQALDNPKP